MKHDFDFAGPDVERIGLQHGSAAADRDRDHRNARLYREIEGALFERPQRPIPPVPMAFGKENDRAPRADALGGLIEAFHRLLRLAALDWNMPGSPQVPTEERDIEQRAFRHKTEFHWQANKQNGNIHRTRVIRTKNRWPVFGDILEALDAEPDAAGCENQVRPETCTAMLPSPAGIEWRARE